jgi:hypothetical protein
VREDARVTSAPGHASRPIAFALAFAALLWAAFLAPVVARAFALGYDEEPRAWIADLTTLHDFAEAVAGAHVYAVFGALTALAYLLLAASLRMVRPAGTALLTVLLVVAGVADPLAYSLPHAVAIMPAMVEFLCLPVLLFTVGRAGWLNRRVRPVAVTVGAGIVVAVAATVALDYWPHGVLVGVAVACCGLVAWAPPAVRP